MVNVSAVEVVSCPANRKINTWSRISERESCAPVSGSRALRSKEIRSGWSADEPDRRYDGEWAGLTGVDFVIVAARRKPGWTKGTWVTTENDGWFVLGEPFDRPMPNGLRTIYPLTAQTTG